MRASEILRKLADVIDSQESRQIAPQAPAPQTTHPNVRVQLAPAEQPAAEQPQSAQDADTTMSPLQQELEIMKKSAGIPSAFDGHQQ
jgi:hypothetical protein